MSAKDDRALYRLAAALALLAALLSASSYAASLLNSIVLGKVGIVLRAQIVAHEPWKWSAFILAAAAAMVQVPVVLALGDLLRPRRLLARLAAAHGLIGVTLASLTQFMQATVSRKAALMMIADKFERAKPAYLAQSSEWNILFPFSTAFALAMLAQTFIAVMLGCLWLAFRRERGLRRFVGGIALAAVTAQAAGVIGYVADLDDLAFGAALADVLYTLVLLLLPVVFWRAAKAATEEEGNKSSGICGMERDSGDKK
jgi:hypothetical protein